MASCHAFADSLDQPFGGVNDRIGIETGRVKPNGSDHARPDSVTACRLPGITSSPDISRSGSDRQRDFAAPGIVDSVGLTDIVDDLHLHGR